MPRKPTKKPPARTVYVEHDDMRKGTRRQTVVRALPKRGYVDDTKLTTRSGTVTSSRNGNITKVKVVDRTAANKSAAKKKASKPVPLGGAKNKGSVRTIGPRKAARDRANQRLLAEQKARKSSVPSKNTGGYTKREKASWGAWSPTRVVKPSKKTAAKAQRRSEQRGRFK